ncbi:MAG: DUF1801 domain-containing protein [Planctomycetes bacterium]|nr:DUF1801 domain-containing protein [Planctomycetota bacterium]
MHSKAATVAQYLAELPHDRREALEAMREVILANVDGDIEEGMAYGMITYSVPHRVFPAGYHCDPRQALPYAMLASQKNHMAIYMMGLYIDVDDGRWFEKAWKAAGKRLDIGKSCVRFKRLDDVPLEVLAEALRRMPSRRYVAAYEAILAGRGKGRSAGASAARKSPKKTPGKAAKKAGPPASASAMPRKTAKK